MNRPLLKVTSLASSVGGNVQLDLGHVQSQIPAQTEEALQEVEHVRNVFPEAWLWANASVQYDICHSDFLTVGCMSWGL